MFICGAMCLLPGRRLGRRVNHVNLLLIVLYCNMLGYAWLDKIAASARGNEGSE